MRRPYRQSDNGIMSGNAKAGKQRYSYQNPNCSPYSFRLEFTYKDRSPEIKDKLVCGIVKCMLPYLSLHEIAYRWHPFLSSQKRLDGFPQLCLPYLFLSNSKAFH